MNETELTQQNESGRDDTGTAGGEAGQVSWLDTLPDELKSNEDLRAFKDPVEVAKAFLDTKGRLQAPPESPDAYQLEIPEGVTVDDGFVKNAKTWAHQAGMSEAQFKAFAAPYIEAQRQLEQSMAQAEQAGVDGLKTEWGGQFDENIQTAKRAIKQFAGPEFLAFLDQSRLGNNPAMIKTFVAIGKAISEDKLIEGDGAGLPPGEVKRTTHGTPILAEYPDMRPK